MTVYSYIFHCKLFDTEDKARLVDEDAVIAHAHSDERAHSSAESSFRALLKEKGCTAKIDSDLMTFTLVSKTKVPGTSEFDQTYRWR